jgi:hypothetical protein
MPKKKDTGLNSPARNLREQKANLGGMPPTKGVDAIDKVNTPPKTRPKGEGGSESIRL